MRLELIVEICRFHLRSKVIERRIKVLKYSPGACTDNLFHPKYIIFCYYLDNKTKNVGGLPNLFSLLTPSLVINLHKNRRRRNAGEYT